MNFIVVAFFTFFSIGCATSPLGRQVPVHPLPAGKVLVYKRTVNFLDLEAPSGDLWVSCTGLDEKANIAFLGFHVADGEKSWEFIYRRPSGASQCLAEEKEYREMIKNAKMIRIVGISPSEEGPEPPDPVIPERFTNVKKRTVSIFIRLQAGDRCKSYFQHHCDLPKEYWADTIPQ